MNCISIDPIHIHAQCTCMPCHTRDKARSLRAFPADYTINTHTQHIVRCEFITYESKAMAILRHELHVQRALARTTTNITSPKVDTKYIYAAVHNAIRMDQPISAIRTQRYSAICVSFAELCYCWRYCCTTTSKFSLLF